ncbi:class I adenylate-forming enzyme family protein [Parasphingorhabdus sp.]|uniref:class I adenylate-forming enzyme family protein n=1 Tax=Parasphingorhabdus sp. TaxID=2709688 RepID=UPI003A9371A3
MSANALSIVAGPPLAEEEGLGELTLSGWFLHVTAQFAEREALVFYDEGKRVSWTYADMRQRAFEVARALIAAGVGKGTRVGILMTNRPEFLAATFGTALAGGVATTISTFSTQNELEHLVNLSCCSVLLLERQILKKDFSALIEAIAPEISNCSPGQIVSGTFPFLTHVAAIGEAGGAIETWDDFLARGQNVGDDRVLARAERNRPSDPGVLFFSSGSTAMPKGVLSAHRGVTLQLWRFPKYYGVERTPRVWSANGFFWSGNFAMAFGGGLTRGGVLVLQSTFQPEQALALMETEKVNQVHAWPHQWEQLVAAPNWPTVDLSAMYYVDRTSPLAEHPTITTDWREPYATYGNTETFTFSSTFPSNTPEEVIGGSHGKPCPGNIFKIVAPLTGETVPMGERGEICVKGPTMMLGYIGIPLDETLDDEGYLRTGDGGWFDDQGRLHWEGRLNDIIKTGGANVSPLEIDAVLKKNSGIKAVQTVGIPHDTLGEIVVTCIVPHEGAKLDQSAVQSFAKEKLASYKVPRRVLFFAEEDLQLTGSAKIKAADVKKLAAERLAGEI